MIRLRRSSPLLHLGYAVPFGLVVQLFAASAWAAPLTLNITGLTELEGPEDGFGEGDCWGDYTYRVTMNGQVFEKSEFSIDPGFGTGCILGWPAEFPDSLASFSATADIPDGVDRIIVTIEITDVDTFNDDTIDVNPDPGARVLRLSVDPVTGAYTAVDAGGEPLVSANGIPTVSPPTYEGTSEDRVQISLSFASSVVDSDGDGIPDGQETAGFDWNLNGTIGDVPGEITDPMRADMFVELDIAASPTSAAFGWRRRDIQAMKAAFARAPRLNPDGSFGITLWVDTGSLVDVNATEGGVAGACRDGIDNASGTATGVLDGADTDCVFIEGSLEDAAANCNDGIDNNGDGTIDGADPSCLVGDDLGGGGRVTPTFGMCNLDANFYLAKNADPDGDGTPNDTDGDGNPDNLFGVERRRWFRYSMSIPNSDPDPTVDSDGDGNLTNDPCGSGGQAEIGGNDFVDHNGDGGTLMHELGHTLALRHGGFENLNCKPNHVSVMNYTNQFGIQRVGGGVIIDYAPAGIDLADPLSRNDGPATFLDESALDETEAVDASDPVNQFVFTDGALATVDLDGDGTPDDLIAPAGADAFGLLRSSPLDQQVDWDGSGTAGDNTNAAINVSQAGRTLDATGAVTGVSPRACRGSGAGEGLAGADEWSVIQVPFRHNGDAANSAILPDDPEITYDVLVSIAVATDIADLEVTLVDDPDPVVAGQSGSVTGTVVNHGPNPADGVVATFDVPSGFTPAAVSTECTASGATVVCIVDNLLVGESIAFVVQYDVAADAAFPSPTIATHTFDAVHRGTDPETADNVVSEDTRVVAVADLSVFGASVTGGPLQFVGEPALFDVSATTANDGPSSPMHATVEVLATHGFALTNAESPIAVAALAIGDDRLVETTVELTCSDAGTDDLVVDLSITPASLFDVDPNPLNNVVATSTEVECILPVAVNLRPGQFPNHLNAGAGAFEVGILTTAVGEYDLPLPFDTAWVDPDSLVLAAQDDALAGFGSIIRQPPGASSTDLRELSDERTRDGDDDLRMFFTASQTGLAPGDTVACVVGRFERPDGSGGRFMGCDSVVVLP